MEVEVVHVFSHGLPICLFKLYTIVDAFGCIHVAALGSTSTNTMLWSITVVSSGSVCQGMVCHQSRPGVQGVTMSASVGGLMI